MSGRYPIRYQNIINQGTVVQGGLTSVVAQFPLGEPWFMMILTLTCVLTVGTGTTPVLDGQYGAIKNILIKCDKDGIIVNCAGRGLMRLAQMISRTTPYFDNIAASNGTYKANLPIYFSNPMFLRPEDCVFDTGRQNMVEFYLTFGGVADLLGTVGSATIVETFDLAIVKGQVSTAVNKRARPYVKPYIMNYPPQDPSASQYIELEKAKDLAIAHWLAYSANTVVAGVPFSGTASDTTIASWSIHDNIGFPVYTIAHYNMQYLAKIEQQIETWPSGWIWYNFVKDGSIFSCYPTGDKSMFRLEWINGTLSSSAVTPVIFGVRTLAA